MAKATLKTHRALPCRPKSSAASEDLLKQPPISNLPNPASISSFSMHFSNKMITLIITYLTGRAVQTYLYQGEAKTAMKVRLKVRRCVCEWFGTTDNLHRIFFRHIKILTLPAFYVIFIPSRVFWRWIILMKSRMSRQNLARQFISLTR